MAILINKDHKIKSSNRNQVHLVQTEDIDQQPLLVEEQTYQAYKKLQGFLKKQGIEIGISSAYRTLEKQQEIYEEFIVQYGIETANKLVAPVGTSEHHSGLAIDLNVKIDGHFLETNDELYQAEEIWKKIHPVLASYGFILRYPKEKEDITGYPYEPWHIRYVGKFIASIIEKNKYTLEEYHQQFSGILVVNKKSGMTSFDVVKKISQLFGIKKIGHTGTLDPLAEGVLVITIGKASKIAELLTAEEKEYQAGALLGVRTDTLDITGKVVASQPVFDNANIEETLKTFNKTYKQKVPIYSAVKIKGKKLYEYARKNEEIKLPEREVTIKDMKLLETDRDTFMFQCRVSKGCYIRSLIDDIGKSLNTYATMTKLVRIKQGKFSIENASTLEEIDQGKFHLYQIEEALEYPIIEVNYDLEKKIIHGQKVPNLWQIKEKVVFKNKTKILGIYEVEDKHLKTWKNFS